VSVRLERILLAAILTFFVFSIARSIGAGSPFEYDEAVYAGKARAWVHDTPDTGWAAYRGPGLPVVAVPIVAVTEDEDAFRWFGGATGLLLLLAVWALTRAMSGSAGAALFATGVVAASPEVVLRASQFLTDVPTATLLTALTLLLWRQLQDRDRPSRSLLLVAPLVFGLYSLRYAAAPLIVITLGVAAVVWRERLRAHRGLVAGVVGLTVLLMIPHAVWSLRTFGNLWGQLTLTLSLAHGDEVTNGLGSYLAGIPRALAGYLGGLVMLAGLAGAVFAFLRRSTDAARRWSRAMIITVGVALLDILALGINAPAQPRYIFFPVTMLIVAGSMTLARVLKPARLVPLVTVLAVAVVGAAGWRAERVAHARSVVGRAARTRLANAARWIEQDAGARGCAFLTTHPELGHAGWYSHCRGQSLGSPPETGREALLPPAVPRYLMLSVPGPDTPEGALLDYYLAMASTRDPVASFPGKAATILVWRMNERGADTMKG
jgi:hypothetical protein